MSFETDFDTAFSILLGKAQNTISQTAPSTSTPATTSTGIAAASSYNVAFEWGGGGAALAASSTDPIVVEVPDAGEIVWCHLYAGNASATPVSVTAVLSLLVTSYDTFGSSSALNGSGTSPRLTASSKASMSLSGWTGHLDAGSTLIASISSFSGSATWLAMILKVRRDDTA